jgi:hypothetical protein
MMAPSPPLVAPLDGAAPVRVARSGPSDTVDPLEAALAARGDRIRDDAEAHLQSLLPGLGLDSWIRHPVQADMFVGQCHWPAGQLEEVAEQVDQLLRHHDVRAQMEAIIGGQAAQSSGLFRERSVSFAGAQLRVGAAAGALAMSGMTFRLTAVDEQVPALGSLNLAVDAVYGARSAANAYLTGSSTPGSRAHFDHHDVILLQIVGRKGWRVSAPLVRPAPGVAGEPPIGDPLWEGVLQPGEALALPRGWVHEPVPTGGLSMHVTLAVRRPAFAELLAELARGLGTIDDDWSEDLPGSAVHPDETGAQLSERLRRRADSPESVTRSCAAILAYYRAQLPPRPTAPLSRMVAAMERPLSCSYRWAVPTEPLVVDDAAGGYAVAGWVIRANRAQAEMLVDATGSRCWIPPADADDSQIELLRALIEIEALDPIPSGGSR